MTAKIKMGYEMYKSISAVANIQNEANLSFDVSGLEVKELSVNGISAMHIFVAPSICQTYEVSKPVVVGINTANFKNILKTFDKKDTITMEVTNDKIILQSITKTFLLPIIEHRGADKLPEIEYPVSIIFNAKEFKKLLKDISLISGFLGFSVSNNEISITAKGDAGETKFRYGSEHIQKIVSSINNTMFNVEEINKLISVADNKSNIDIYLKENEPIKIVYEVAGVKVRCYLAPYIEG